MSIAFSPKDAENQGLRAFTGAPLVPPESTVDIDLYLYAYRYMKRIAVIGAGVSGMAAAIYCLKSGLDVTVYEKHTKSGGLCSGWKRSGYSFEGAVHWINDSAASDPIYRLWCETGILGDEVAVFRSDPYFVYEYNGIKIHIYRDIHKLKAHLLEISPDDSKAIEMLYRDVQAIRKVKIPLFDIPGLKTRKKNRLDIPLLLQMIPGILKLGRLSKYSAKEYAAAFKHPGIRKALGEFVVYEQFSSLSLLHTMACFMDSGVYPKGGSLELGKRMEQKIKALGGRILFNTKVDSVLFDGKTARGITVQGEHIPFDAVIVTQDLLTVQSLLGSQPKDKWIQAAQHDPPVQTTFASIGVREDLRDMPYAFALDGDIHVGGIPYDCITLTNYAEHTSYAPPGCTSLTCSFTGDSYAYWKALKENGTYEEHKQQLADELKRIIEKNMPRLQDKIAVIDIATPLTYERYTGSYKGAWMTVLLKSSKPSLPRSISAAYKRLYFAGFRTRAPGGLPIALLSGYKAAQYVCRDLGMVFEGTVK
ncbi:MAG: NAD(P)/FAD-dependent oxidoreductase [Treponema sp.]|nr:NAD(P)/FAD-dependent oxidoreductase [Treponema sp.]